MANSTTSFWFSAARALGSPEAAALKAGLASRAASLAAMALARSSAKATSKYTGLLSPEGAVVVEHRHPRRRPREAGAGRGRLVDEGLDRALGGAVVPTRQRVG